MLLESQQTSIPDRKLKLFVAPLGSEHQMSCIKISNELRKSGHAVMMDYTKTGASNLSSNERVNAMFIIHYFR